MAHFLYTLNGSYLREMLKSLARTRARLSGRPAFWPSVIYPGLSARMGGRRPGQASFTGLRRLDRLPH